MSSSTMAPSRSSPSMPDWTRPSNSTSSGSLRSRRWRLSSRRRGGRTRTARSDSKELWLTPNVRPQRSDPETQRRVNACACASNHSYNMQLSLAHLQRSSLAHWAHAAHTRSALLRTVHFRTAQALHQTRERHLAAEVEATESTANKKLAATRMREKEEADRALNGER
eukprot:3613651-Prymnesium_polylepis.2